MNFLNNMSTKYVLLLFCIGFTFFTSCVTPYQSAGLRGGFSETQLSENVFRVYFNGNGYTNSKRSTDFVLLRSAELTLINNFIYFIIVDSTSNTNISTYTSPTTSSTSGTMNTFGNHVYGHSTTTTSGGNTYFIKKPATSSTIVMYKEKPKDEIMVYKASFICNSIGHQYGISCAGN